MNFIDFWLDQYLDDATSKAVGLLFTVGPILPLVAALIYGLVQGSTEDILSAGALTLVLYVVVAVFHTAVWLKKR